MAETKCNDCLLTVEKLYEKSTVIGNEYSGCVNMF